MINEFSSDEFTHILREKEKTISIRTSLPIQENENYKRLHRSLISIQSTNHITDFIAVLISIVDLENLSTEVSIEIPLTADKNYLVYNNELTVLFSEKKELQDELRAELFYQEISKGYCLFLITPEGVNPFIDGQNIGSLIFYKKKDFRTWKKLKDVSQIEELFDKYRRHLGHRYNYSGFFVSKSAKKSLHHHLINAQTINSNQEEFLEKNYQLLENKPEDRFRESLRAFLVENMRNDIFFGKEYVLESFKRLDINIFDDYGDLYFIEVKWVGTSVHSEGNKIGTKYDHNDINPAAINQSLKYIRELVERDQTIKIGYLAVFDAREEDLDDTITGFDLSSIDEENQQYYSNFKKIPDFRVKNSHPN